MKNIFLGIDFSSDLRMWRKNVLRPRVWIAAAELNSNKPVLLSIMPVQKLPGSDPPFQRLVKMLKKGDYVAAAIDAPFSIPENYVPARKFHFMLELLSKIIPRDRPFPKGPDFVNLVAPELGFHGKKLFRNTEKVWMKYGVIPRSPLWAGPRGGAGLTAAVTTLIHRSKIPVWPISTNKPLIKPFLAEAFPAAQLARWGLPFKKYNGSSQQAFKNRQKILNGTEETPGLKKRLNINKFEAVLLASADALDAVICTFAGMAVFTNSLALPPSGAFHAEGWIAVHR